MLANYRRFLLIVDAQRFPWLTSVANDVMSLRSTDMDEVLVEWDQCLQCLRATLLGKSRRLILQLSSFIANIKIPAAHDENRFMKSNIQVATAEVDMCRSVDLQFLVVSSRPMIIIVSLRRRCSSGGSRACRRCSS